MTDKRLSTKLVNSIWPLIEFSQIITANRQKLTPEIITFKDQCRKIVEELREFSFAVDGTQGNPEEHTRDCQVHEGLDLLFATLSSYNILNFTRDELTEQLSAIIDKFKERSWLD